MIDRAKTVMSAVAPSAAPTSIEIFVVPLVMLALMEDIALLAIRVPSSLGRDGRWPEAVPMEVVEVSTPSDKAFVVELFVLPKRVLIEIGDITFPSVGVSIIGSVSAFSSHAEMANAASPSAANSQIRLIDTTFGITNLLVDEPHTLGAKKVEAHAKRLRPMPQRQRGQRLVLWKQQRKEPEPWKQPRKEPG